jgi:structural maintenance of chromosome 4
LEIAPVDSLPIEQKRGQTSIQSQILEEEEMKLEEEEEVDTNLKRAAPIDIDEEAPPTLKGRRTTKPKVSIQQSDDEMDATSLLSEVDEDEDDKPIPKRKVPTARKAKVTTKKLTVIEDSDDDSDIQAPPNAQPRLQQHNGVPDAAHVASLRNSERQPSMPAAEDLEEEKSLFDPPPMPEPSNLPRAITEEPVGPKSRLVIHKMVLINFKSYAGRQEIGPFHKVINIRQRPTI